MPAWTHFLRCAGAVAVAVASISPGSSVRAQSIVETIVALDRASPLDHPSVERLLGRALDCRKPAPANDVTFCEARNLELAGVKVGSVDFRNTGRGSILVLDDLAGPCIPADLESRFGQGPRQSNCTDGVVCVYATYKRPWGLLAIGLGKDWSATCAKSVVFNADNAR